MPPFARLILVALTLIAAVGCDAGKDEAEASAASVKDKWQDFTRELSRYTESEREQLSASVKRETQQLDRQIGQLENRIETAGAGMADKQRQALRQIRKQREALSRQYQQLREDTGEAWQESKAGFTKAYNVLQQSLQDAEQALNRDNPDTSDDQG